MDAPPSRNIPRLVQCLIGGDEEEEAALALGSLARRGRRACAAIEAAGGVPALVRCLRLGRSEHACAAAVAALCDVVAYGSQAAASAVADDAMHALLRHLRTADSSKLREECMGVLQALAGGMGKAALLSTPGMLEAMVSCLRDGSAELRQHTAVTISFLAWDPEANAALLAAGAVPALRSCLRSGGDSRAPGAALQALLDLEIPTSGQATAAAIDAVPGGYKALVGCLQHPSDDVQECAAILLHNMAMGSRTAHPRAAAIAAAGGQAALQHVLATSENEDVLETVEDTLALLPAAIEHSPSALAAAGEEEAGGSAAPGPAEGQMQVPPGGEERAPAAPPARAAARVCAAEGCGNTQAHKPECLHLRAQAATAGKKQAE